ncbi:decarboxylase [Nocardia tengchongensis]|uniref:decarboxylase n=1 Tax=Nocardia tengchongensis TaxID=2055889 RepID=UPI0036A27C15
MTAAAAPGLPAKMHALVSEFLATPGAVADAVAAFGSPAHLVFPQVFAENLERLRAELAARVGGFRICYAHKVNQSRAFVAAARAAGIGIDVASEAELAAALKAGFEPEHIEVTGPKGEGLLRALVGSGVTINVENLWELERVAALTDTPVPVLVRMCGFTGTPVSRFGVPLAEIDRVLAMLVEQRDRIEFRGFAFHLDSGEPAERVRAVESCLELTERAYGYGLTPSVLDIGGGFRQVFTADAGAFDAYVHALRESLVGRGEQMTWGGNTFGFHVEDGAVHGTPVFHKYANIVDAPRMLADLLDTGLESHGGRSFAQVAGENILDIWLEPGKALVDHAGITVARVEFVKRTADGSTLVNLDLSRDTVTPADQEVMVDPILIPAETRPDGGDPALAHPNSGAVGVFLAGRLCLERDLITNHKVWLERYPQSGDFVVFPNTAAYHMDLSAARASMHPVPPKLAVARESGVFRVCRDLDWHEVH